jgi:hypothetical protein
MHKLTNGGGAVDEDVHINVNLRIKDHQSDLK